MTVPREVVEFASSTGNSFQSKVVEKFRRGDWYTKVSPYYLDAATNRAREIDLVAEKVWNVGSLHAEVGSRLHMKLFVECKYVPEATVFWFDAKDEAAASEWLVQNTPLPSPSNTYTSRHHYLAGEPAVAKLFGTRQNRDTDREAMYKALNQALHAMVYLRRRRSNIPRDDRDRVPSYVIELPVIVVSTFANLFRVDIGDEDVRPISENFLLEVNYAYLDTDGNDRNEYFLVDVVSLDKLDAFFAALESDAEAMKPFAEHRR